MIVENKDSKSSTELIHAEVIAKLAGLGLHARIPMLGGVSGRHRSPVRGSSLEFAQYRKYVPGDDTRRMDWRVWGRSDRYFIKEFEADTNLRLGLIVDTSGSLNFAVDGVSKLTQMKKIAAALAFLAVRQGDAVGLYCAGKEEKTLIRPKRNAAHLRLILDKLSNLKAEGETCLAESLHEAAEGVSQRALIVVISDLFVEPKILKDCFQHLKFRKHDVAVFHLLDQSEVDFAVERPTRFLDLEGGDPIMADPSMIRSAYHQAMSGYLSDLDQATRDAGVDYHRVQLNDPVEEIIARFLIGRTPKSKGASRR